MEKILCLIMGAYMVDKYITTIPDRGNIHFVALVDYYHLLLLLIN